MQNLRLADLGWVVLVMIAIFILRAFMFRSPKQEPAGLPSQEPAYHPHPVRVNRKEVEVPAAEVPRSHLPTTHEFLVFLARSLHLLVIGHTGGGKTTMLHALAVFIAKHETIKVVVLDTDAAPGMYPGCKVVGYGGDEAAILAELTAVHSEFDRRRKLRGEGQQRIFDYMYVFIDEYDQIGAHEEARKIVENILRRGRKLNIHLMIGIQDMNVDSMGFEGKGTLRRQFSYVAEMFYEESNQKRELRIWKPTNHRDFRVMPTPVFEDPENLVEREMERRRLSKDFTKQDVDDALVSPIPNGEGPLESRNKSVVTINPIEVTPLPASNEPDLASGPDFSVFGNVTRDQIIARIAAELGRGTSPSNVAKSLPGYSPKEKYDSYMAVVLWVQSQLNSLQPTVKPVGRNGSAGRRRTLDRR